MDDPSYHIQEATENDFIKLIELFQKENFFLNCEELLEWKYLRNPAGKSKIFVVKDNNGRILGSLVYSPRRFFIPNVGEVVMMQAIDAFFAKELRGKKQYKKILRYSMEKISNPMYTFPNSIAERAELKCGWQVLSEVQRWIFPINIGDKANMTRKYKVLRNLINYICKIYARFTFGFTQNHIILKPVSKFNKIYDHFNNVFFGERTMEYLNWRFCQNPLKNYHCFEFYENEKMIGYCVISIKGNSASIFDFNVENYEKRCLEKIVDFCRDSNIAALVYDNVQCNLDSFGFLRMKTNSKVLVYRFPYQTVKMNYADSDWDFL